MGLCVAFELLAKKVNVELVARFGLATSGLRNRRSSTETKPALKLVGMEGFELSLDGF